MEATLYDSRLDKNDPELLFIVTEAAAELDRAANHRRPAEFLATQQLANVLKQWVPSRAGEGATAARFDVSTVGIASQVFNATRATKVCEVVNQVWEMAEKFEHIERCSSISEFEEGRGFCVKLGRSLLDFRASADQYYPSNPYKR